MSSTTRPAAVRLDPSDFLDLDALLSDEERLVRDTVRGFVRDRVLPGIDGWFEAWECDGKLIRMELFIEREPALEAAGLPPEHQEEMR